MEDERKPDPLELNLHSPAELTDGEYKVSQPLISLNRSAFASNTHFCVHHPSFESLMLINLILIIFNLFFLLLPIIMPDYTLSKVLSGQEEKKQGIID